MTLETLVQLARSRTPADRSRIQLATAAFGLSGALLLGALRVARLGGGELDENVYSNYVAESGLMSVSPTARRLIFEAAETYRSINAGEVPRTSAMLSKPSTESSAGSTVAALISLTCLSLP